MESSNVLLYHFSFVCVQNCIMSSFLRFGFLWLWKTLAFSSWRVGKLLFTMTEHYSNYIEINRNKYSAQWTNMFLTIWPFCFIGELSSLYASFVLLLQLMILVDDVGGIVPTISHSPWNGVMLADFVFPFFLFIVGVSLAFAYKVTK